MAVSRKGGGETVTRYLMLGAVETYPNVPSVIHPDRATSPKVCQGAIDLGYG